MREGCGEDAILRQGSGQARILPAKKKSTLGTLSANIKVEGDGSWDWQGFGNIDGQKALIEGTASYVASTFSGGMRNEYMRAFSSALIGAYVKKGVSELFEHYGGRDFGDTYSLDKPITVDTLSIAMNQSLDDLKGKLQYAFLSDEKKKSMTDAEKARYGMGKETQTFWQKLANGVGGVIDDFASIGSSFAEELRTIRYDMLNIGDVLTLPFVQRSGLTSAERAKMLDESRRAWEDKSMERWLLTTYYKDEKKWNDFVDEMGLDAKNKDLARDMRKVDEFSEKYGTRLEREKSDKAKESFFHDMNKIRAFNEYFDAKVRLSKTLGGEYALSEEDIFNLSRSIKQDSKNHARNEALSLQLQNKLGYSENEAHEIASGACFLDTMYFQLKIEGATLKDGKAMGDIAEFYSRHIKDGGIINGNEVVGSKVLDDYLIDGRKVTMEIVKSYDKFLELGEQGVKYGHLRWKSEFTGGGHSAPVYWDEKQRKFELSDVSGREKGIPVKSIGKEQNKNIKTLFSWFMYLKY